MSLIKNGDGVKVSTFEQVPGNTSYKIKEYIDLNGATIPIFNVDSNYKNKLRLKDTVVILANLDNYDGYLFGDWSAGNISNEMCIYKTGNQVLWFFGQGGTEQNQIVYARVTYQSGIHLYGFSNGDAIYDNQILSSNLTVNGDLYMSTSKTNASYFLIGRSATGHCIIYRIIISCSDTLKTYSYYPCANSEHKRIYEALSTGRFVYDAEYTSSGTNTYLNFDSAIVGNNVKYGISLDDIKSITGSKYRDLMAIITEDSGITVTPDAHNSFIIRDNNNLNHEFAFYLGKNNETDKIELNPNYTAVGNNSLFYKPGELIYGRRPKWNIWANSMPYSIWNRPETDYTNGYYDPDKKVYAMYNITQHWSKNGKVHLEWFLDYCDSDENRPEIKFINKDGSDARNIEIHYHNGVVCLCDNDVIFPGLCYTGATSSANRMFRYTFTNRSIFNYSNILPNSSVWMKLGNIINWKASQIEQYEADYLDANEEHPTLNQLIYGDCGTLTHSFLTFIDIGGSISNTPVKVDILIGYANEQTRQLQSDLPLAKRLDISNTPFVALSSDTDSVTRSKFKDGLVDDGEGNLIRKQFEQLRATGNEPVRLYNEILCAVNSSGLHTYAIDAVGSMNLLKKREEIGETETPSESDMVYLSKFILPTTLTIEGKFDRSEIDGSSLFNLLKEARWQNLNLNSRIFPDSSLYLQGSEYVEMGSIVPSQTNTTMIFMNERKTTINNDSFNHLDRLYLHPSSESYIPLYFFPIGFPIDNYTESQEIQYEFITEGGHQEGANPNTYRKGGLSIPFVLTTADFTTYQRMISNYDPSIGGNGIGGYNYYIHEEGSPAGDESDQLYVIKTYADNSLYGTVDYQGDSNHRNIYYCRSKNRYYPPECVTRVKDGYCYVEYTTVSGGQYVTEKKWTNSNNSSYKVTNYRCKYPTNLKLRFIAELVNNENIGTENDPVYQLKKDRVSHLVYRSEDSAMIWWSVRTSGDVAMTEVTNLGTFEGSNYLNLNTDCDSKWFIWIKPTELPNICGSNRDNNNNPETYSKFIPQNITIKFWVFNEDYAPAMLNYETSFAYMDVNDSWYKNVALNCVYIFIKDMQNNEWMKPALTSSNYRDSNNNDRYCYTFKQIISHWFKGKKVNLFKCTNSNLTNNNKPVGGTYASPTLENDSTFSGWTDTINIGSSSNKIWMTERFYAVPDNQNASDTVALYITDSEWSTPVEITNYKGTKYQSQTYPDGDHASFILYVDNQFNDDFESNPANYIKYIENDGFYGVYDVVTADNGQKYVFLKSLVEKFDLRQSGLFVRTYRSSNEFEEINEVEYLPTGTWNVKLIYINEDDLTIYSYLDISSYSGNLSEYYNTLYTNYKIKSTKTYHIGYSNGAEVKEDVNDYILQQKYMFSIDSAQTPDSEPNKWITLDELKQLNNTSSYNFMYREEILFNLLGEYRKVFEIIQIGGEQTLDKFYPAKVLDIAKLDSIARTRLVWYDGLHYYEEKYWYAIGGYYNTDKYYMNNTWLNVGRNEILAPYKINNLNVSVYDILQSELEMNVFVDRITDKTCYIETVR